MALDAGQAGLTMACRDQSPGGASVDASAAADSDTWNEGEDAT